MNIIDVNAENVAEKGIFCIKDKKSSGFKDKIDWFISKLNEGLKIKIIEDDDSKQLGFIEYIPSELAWRPVIASNYLFIQCIMLYSNEAKGKGLATLLLSQCEADALQSGKSGVCSMTSDGSWIAGKELFIKNNYTITDNLGRFELVCKAFDDNEKPRFYDWTKQHSKYSGWNLIYSAQCPWHDKSVKALKQTADEFGINLKITKLTTPAQAQKAPSGFGTFSLIKDGKLIEDHYLSQTRFVNILKKELKH